MIIDVHGILSMNLGILSMHSWYNFNVPLNFFVTNRMAKNQPFICFIIFPAAFLAREFMFNIGGFPGAR